MNYLAVKVSEILAVLNDGGCLSSAEIYHDSRVSCHILQNDPNTYAVFCEALAHLVDERKVVQSGDLYTLAPDDRDAYQEYLDDLAPESRENVERMNAKTGDQLYELYHDPSYGMTAVGDDEVPGEDAVNNPAHYTQGRKYETIDVIEDWKLNFHLGNVVKYISRAGRKGDRLEDLNKAAWYLARYIETLEAGK